MNAVDTSRKKAKRKLREQDRLLNGSIIKPKWSQEEEELLMKKVEEHGKKWYLIQKYFEGRSENDIKSRWKLMMNKFIDFPGVDDVLPLNNDNSSYDIYIPPEDNNPTFFPDSTSNMILFPQMRIANENSLLESSIDNQQTQNNSMKQVMDIKLEDLNEKSTPFNNQVSETKFSYTTLTGFNINVPCSFYNGHGIYYDVIDIINRGSSCINTIVKRQNDQNHDKLFHAKIISKEYLEKNSQIN